MTRPNMSHMSALGQKTALDEPMEAPFSLGEALPKILQQEPTNAGSQSNITGGIGQGDNGFGNLINISEDDTAYSLSEKLSNLGASLLMETLEDYISVQFHVTVS